MKKAILLLISIIVLSAAVVYVHIRYKNIPPGSWQWDENSTRQVSWIPFEWTSDSLSGRYFEKTAMYVNTQLDNITDTFVCQLDLGSNMTMLYENPIKHFNHLDEKSYYYKERIFGDDKHKCVRDVEWHLGSVNLKSHSVIMNQGYGDTSTVPPIKIGTIGVDMFQDKVLVIDFPNQRFCVLDEIKDNKARYTPLELSAGGFIILPVKIGGKVFKCLYDSGSSLFSIITYPGHIKDFSTEADDDSFIINSWGKQVMAYSRNLYAETNIMGQVVPNNKVYSLSTVEDFLKEANADAMLGNALFWNNTIIIDFKHKRFGIR